MEDFVLADTNVVSYLFKKDTRGSVYKPYIEHKLVFIAAQTFAEIELLPLNNKWSRKRHEKLRENLKNYVFIEASREISVRWAEIQAEARKKGKPVSVGDAWIAATALIYNIPLVTHNPDDFKNISGLKIITEKH